LSGTGDAELDGARRIKTKGTIAIVIVGEEWGGADGNIVSPHLLDIADSVNATDRAVHEEQLGVAVSQRVPSICLK